MSYRKIIHMYDERREKLMSLVDDSSIDLNAERQNKLRGAVDEISMFISVLEQMEQRTMDMQAQMNVASIQGASGKTGFFGKVFG